jgi:hypothetical protein
MFSLQLVCSCRVDLIPGNLPLFVASCDCDMDHPCLNPYNGVQVSHIKCIDDLDIVADSMMMETEGRELCDNTVWQ